MNEFYMLLNSNASNDIFVDNSQTSFTNLIPNNVKLSEGWHVALQSLCVATSFSTNVPKEVRKTNKHIILCNSFGMPTKLISIPDNNYTKETMTAFLQNQFFETVRQSRLKTRIETLGDTTNFIVTATRCQIRINEDVCKWLNIDTTGRQLYEETHLDYFLNIVPSDDNEVIRVYIFEPDEFYEQTETEVFFNFQSLPRLMPSMIKVKLGEMKQSLSSYGNHQNLATIQFKPPNDFISFYYEAQQKEYFPLNSHLIQTLSIKLTDSIDDELNLFSHHPTFVKLKFKKMSTSSFILRLSSADSTDIYPENTASSFRIQLPKIISLNGHNWQVALSTILYPSEISLSDYLSHQDVWIEYYRLHRNDWLLAHQYNFKNEKIRSFQHLEMILNANTYVARRQKQFRIKIHRNSKKTTYDSDMTLKIRMSKTLASMLGSSTDNFITDYRERNKLIGFADIKRCMPNTISLHTDFTSPIVAGGKYCRLLKFIPILQDLQATDGSVYPSVSYESHHMDFVNLSTSDLQSLQFELKDGVGKPLVFTNNNIVTFVNLLFSKI
jgi:hypothetical protein